MRYNAIEPASLSECLHEAILAERKFPGHAIQIFEWDRSLLKVEDLHEIIEVYIDELKDPNNMTVRIPFSTGADIVMCRGDWTRPIRKGDVEIEEGEEDES